MLTLTPQAATAIRSLTSRPDLPEQTGIRIFTTEDASPTNLGLSVAAAPEPQDQVVESEGARVFMDPVAAEMLNDQALDAQVSDEGQVQFRLFDQ